MKMEWKKPEFYSEKFVANQRIASCGTILDGDVTWECVDYETQEALCDGNSEHNTQVVNALNKAEIFASKDSCDTLATSMDELLPILESITHWKYQEINKPKGAHAVAYNSSGNHVIDVQGLNFYENPFKS